MHNQRKKIMSKVAAVSAIVLLIALALAVVYPSYECAGIYCAADGTSFWTWDYSKVQTYNNK